MSNKFEELSNIALKEGLTEHAKMLTARAYPRSKHHSKIVYARRIGLHYWPALIAPTWGDENQCDPKAFLAFEQFQKSKGVLPWGTKRTARELWDWELKWGKTPHEALGQHRGGWDSQGHWGASPDFVKKAWFAAGCRESGKLFLQFSAGVIAKKGDSITFFKNYLRGYHWISHGCTSNSNPQHGWAAPDYGVYGWSRKALATLGRLSPEARYWATKGVKGEYRHPVRIRDLNWAGVRHLEDLRGDSSPEALRERQATVPRGMAFVIGGLPHDSTGNNPGFVVRDSSDGVTIVTAEKPTISVAGCTVFSGETVVITEKPKKMYLVRKGNRTYHCGWKEVADPRGALREALGAWRKQDEATAWVRDRFQYLLRSDVTILVTRQDSYQAGNCSPGTESWIESTGIGRGRWCVPASALLAHAGDGRVANILAVVNREAGILLAEMMR